MVKRLLLPIISRPCQTLDITVSHINETRKPLHVFNFQSNILHMYAIPDGVMFLKEVTDGLPQAFFPSLNSKDTLSILMETTDYLQSDFPDEQPKTNKRRRRTTKTKHQKHTDRILTFFVTGSLRFNCFSFFPISKIITCKLRCTLSFVKLIMPYPNYCPLCKLRTNDISSYFLGLSS